MTDQANGQENGQENGQGVPATPVASGQAPANVPGQAPTSDGQAPNEPQSPTQSLDSVATEAKYRKAVDDNNAMRKKLKDFEDAQLNEQQKLQKQLDEYQQKEQTWREQVLAGQIQVAASKLGLADPEVAAKLVDHSLLQIDEATGLPTNLQEVLTGMIAKWPFLKGQQAPISAGSAANAPSANGQSPTFTTSQLEDPAFYKAHKDEIWKAYQEGRILQQ